MKSTIPIIILVYRLMCLIIALLAAISGQGWIAAAAIVMALLVQYHDEEPQP